MHPSSRSCSGNIGFTLTLETVTNGSCSECGSSGSSGLHGRFRPRGTGLAQPGLEAGWRARDLIGRRSALSNSARPASQRRRPSRGLMQPGASKATSHSSSVSSAENAAHDGALERSCFPAQPTGNRISDRAFAHHWVCWQRGAHAAIVVRPRLVPFDRSSTGADLRCDIWRIITRRRCARGSCAKRGTVGSAECHRARCGNLAAKLHHATQHPGSSTLSLAAHACAEYQFLRATSPRQPDRHSRSRSPHGA